MYWRNISETARSRNWFRLYTRLYTASVRPTHIAPCKDSCGALLSRQQKPRQVYSRRRRTRSQLVCSRSFGNNPIGFWDSFNCSSKIPFSQLLIPLLANKLLFLFCNKSSFRKDPPLVPISLHTIPARNITPSNLLFITDSFNTENISNYGGTLRHVVG